MVKSNKVFQRSNFYLYSINNEFSYELFLCVYIHIARENEQKILKSTVFI